MSETKSTDHNDLFASKWPNLADERLGTTVLFATDDFFAEKENLIKPGRGIFIADKYTDRGKWMDGWESRRKRTPGNDYCIIRLGQAGIIRGLDIDTNFFLGNHPPFASVEGTFCTQGDPDESTEWTSILPKSALHPGAQNLFPIENQGVYSHVRLQIYPDGGVARFRVYGDVHVDWSKFADNELIDLAAIENGGSVLICNDMFFSSKDNLIFPGRGKNMGDGWETRRKRHPGHDWVILQLAKAAVIEKIEVDTAHFKGNFPDQCSIDVATMEEGLKIEDLSWQELLPKQKLQADHQHYYASELNQLSAATHLRLNIYPDGGISRLRCWGRP